MGVEEYNERRYKLTLCVCSLTESDPFIALLYESSDEVNVVLQGLYIRIFLMVIISYYLSYLLAK